MNKKRHFDCRIRILRSRKRYIDERINEKISGEITLYPSLRQREVHVTGK